MSLQEQREQSQVQEGVHDADRLLLDRDSDATPTLSVVMPTLNEEEGVGECIERAKVGRPRRDHPQR